MHDSEKPPRNLEAHEKRQVDVEYHLARALELKGKTNQAVKRYQDLLHKYPDYAPAYVQLGSMSLREGRAREALEYYHKAKQLDPDLPLLNSYYQLLESIIDGKPQELASLTSYTSGSFNRQLVSNPEGKINLKNQLTIRAHRSGWEYAINALKGVHNDQGVLFDGFIERNFGSEHFRQGTRPVEVLELMKSEGTFNVLATSEEKGITPYTRPWVGFIHNPPNMPRWFFYHVSPQRIFKKEIWQKSLQHCIGLFTLSDYHAKWLREQTGVPVSSLVHPSEIPETTFDFELFRDNPRKKIVQVGWWLRKLNAIYQLPLDTGNPLGYKKIRLVPRFSKNSSNLIDRLMAIERDYYNLDIEQDFFKNTSEIQHLSNVGYDQLFSENIVFIDLYDANANNTIIECIARGTPLLVNPLPAVTEYLGKDYPLYFYNLQEAAQKALNQDLILETHNYLMNCDTREKLRGSYFLESFKESQVYKSIQLK